MAFGDRKLTQAGGALFDVVVQVTHAFYRMRAVGAGYGAATPWGGSSLGLLRSLHAKGPQTVPQLARARPVARQHMQKLANELAAEGLVEFIDNPAHKRSRLVRLTKAGEARFKEVSAQIEALIENLARDMDVGDLRTTARVLAQFRERMETL
ncbi:MAG: MarR family winged helix-turn-helix transcriptional regulator [Rhodospirillales bacterium]